MYVRTLAEQGKALRLDHTITLQTVNNLGCLHERQGKLNKVEKMYSRALTGFQEALWPSHEKC